MKCFPFVIHVDMNVARIAEKICNQLMHVMLRPPPFQPPPQNNTTVTF